MNWYCLKVIVGSEYKAERDLNNYYPDRIYLPEIERDKRFRKKGKRQTKRITEPMFSGYLFANLSQDEDDWSNIARCKAKIVRQGQFIPHIKNSEVDRFRRFEQVMKTDYTKGDKIRIAEGMFAGYEGIIESADKANEILLSQLNGKAGQFTMPKEIIEPVE